ncbi:hypothetical protein G6R40_06440 [Chryseobacterium sp. POL2]|uniref:hypothetical protein n=1 Tax=Chryseobacterium sp. POL2 TaxID=2713414 RepID=UPI0013E16C44|nr:hypothetical protein [Chryseobacterium sp. POL2]QIG89341.1 hypothetical protein G6R40_06440 [Chryseobacterium sp. POL2]
MKNKYILLGCLVVSTTAFSQVGINTETPQATLDVTGKATTVTAADGIIAPRITGDQLRAKNAVYTQAQNGTLIYVTEADTAPATKTINVTSPGYYYYDQPTATAGVWRAVSSNDWKLTGNTGTNPANNFVGTTDEQPLVFRVNNSEKLRITPAGRLDFSNPSALANVLVEGGNETMTGTRNTALGQAALVANTTGSYNLALGTQSMPANTEGSWNTAVGNFSLNKIVSGLRNTAVGNYSMEAITTGSNNTAIGNGSLILNTTGIANTAIGNAALSNATTGSRNIALGHYSGSANPNPGVMSQGITTESYSINIGDHTGIPNTLVGQDNTMNIGNLIFGRALTSQNPNAPAGFIGVGVNNPEHRLHVNAPDSSSDPVRIQGLRAGTATDKMVVADATGVLKTVDRQAVANVNAIAKVTAAHTVTATDYTILANATTAGFAITLPNPTLATNTGRILVIRKIDETANAVTFSRAIKVSETTSITSLNVNSTLRIQSDGTAWYLID